MHTARPPLNPPPQCAFLVYGVAVFCVTTIYDWQMTSAAVEQFAISPEYVAAILQTQLKTHLFELR